MWNQILLYNINTPYTETIELLLAFVSISLCLFLFVCLLTMPQCYHTRTQDIFRSTVACTTRVGSVTYQEIL